MSEYRLDVKGSVDLSDYGNIYEYMDIIGVNDKFTISMDYLDEKNIELIITMLKYKDFTIVDNGKNEQGKYYIKAHKDSSQFRHIQINN
ncbi:hypothetical protein [Clostridium pasteurianum]|uniref:Uncharacterized protein n=1 Tax=Clostridium pasteurianum BC1 TaxID=86416 RepID=R4KI12_CLOPA|nr:hypothetical protein [Clostridium pasteurianum]AGK99255.1 hypothetical protein Clopa_4548 [Clostridium pasteurianum BC1]